jgi:hypothetical protein
MPYVKQEDRGKLDVIVELMKSLKIKANGDLNYILFKFCKETIGPVTDQQSYNTYKNFRGELMEIRDEIGRRFLAPYEDKKIEENGDV